MKKTSAILLGALLALIPIAAIKAATPFSVPINLNVTNAYEVGRDYSAEKLLSIEAFQASAATGTLTITRIHDTRTNTVGTITLASSVGLYRQNITNTLWLFRGDRLKFTYSGGATSSLLEVVGELSN